MRKTKQQMDFMQEIAKKKNKKAAKKAEEVSKKTIDIIRTTQRNNIELTAIADNKANVLLSLNAIIIAGMVPLVITNMEKILAGYLYIPICLLGLTCFITIVVAAQVLKPSGFDKKRIGRSSSNPSPFYFGNFLKMEPIEYYEYIEKEIANPKAVKEHLAQDLYYVGKRLGTKMTLIRRAFNFFIAGFFLTILCTFIILMIS